MVAPTKDRLNELQAIISKMPLEACWVAVLPEFGVQWSQVSRAVRSSRLPMVPASVARVLCRHVARNFPKDELADILTRLRLKLIATQERRWYVIEMTERCHEDTSVAHLIRAVPRRVADALKKSRAGRSMAPEVQSVLLGDLIYISAQMVSDTKQGSILYVATPPGHSVALVSSVSSNLLKACVEGLGYKSYEDAQLFGPDIPSLLRIHNQNHNENIDNLTSIPEYKPIPVVDNTGIDYTYKSYNMEYVEKTLGPDPPLLTDLTITSNKAFFDTTKLDKKISLSVHLKSENVAETLKSWVAKGAIAPNSELFHIFRKVKSNKVAIDDEDDSE